MRDLSLHTDSKVLKLGTTEVLKELMKIISETGCVPNVTYDSGIDGVRLEFEGNYNDFNLYIVNRE
jgi:hypothetical protein